jgi:hypothetical protein
MSADSNPAPAAQHQASTEDWAGPAQDQEFAYHAAHKGRRSPQFTVNSARFWQHFGFRADQFAGQLIVDVGAGSRLRTRYFDGARIVAVEPLADRFRTLDFCDLDCAEACFCVPGETLVPELVNRADAVLSINALDHGYDFDKSIQNIAAYLQPGAPAFLSFDLHDQADAMHPLVLTEASCRGTFSAAGLTVSRVMEGVGPFGPNYGHGAAIDFWLVKPRD